MDQSGFKRERTPGGGTPSNPRAPLAPSDLIGEQFGHYQLIAVLANGGMAEIFLGLSSGLQGFRKVCVIKRIHRHLAGQEEFTRMFLDEARLAARLDHPNVVRIYELGEVEGQYFIAMEYLPGEDLGRIFRRAKKLNVPIDPDIAAWLVQCAAEGLHYAHELKDVSGTSVQLVHRDVNPHNILVTYHGDVKLVDFGIAKASTNSSTTEAGTLKGKLAYLAPEQVMGLELDRRCDVFCLGTVMWELLSEERLFLRSTDTSTLAAVSKAEVPPIRSIRKSVPAELEEICLKALARAREDRFQTAGELHDAIDRYFGARARPTARAVGQWLEKLFGRDFAGAKLSIAQGSNLRESITHVVGKVHQTVTAQKLPTMRADSSDLTANEGTHPAFIPLARRALWMSAFLTFAVVSLGAGALVTQPWAFAGAQPVHSRAVLQLTSEPPGASIYVAGEPTGLVTPNALRDVPLGANLSLTLVKPGFRPVAETVAVQGAQAERHFALHPSHGIVRLQDMPPKAQLIVDGRPANAGAPLELEPGTHRLELLLDGEAIHAQSVQVVPGEQVVRLRVSNRGGP